MPPLPAVDHKTILQHLKNVDIFNQNGSLKKYNDPIWTNLCKSIKLKMEPSSLYLYVYKDIESCKTICMKTKNLKAKRKSKFKKSFYDPDFQIYQLKNPNKKPYLNFKIYFEDEEWVKLMPQLANNQKKMKKPWPNIVYTKLFNSQGLRCTYNFKTHTVTGSISDCDISFHGHCTECDTGISGELVRKETDNGIKYGFDIKTFAIQKLYHAKKRHLTSNERDAAKIILENKFATDYREDIQNELMNDRSYEPANLHSSAVYEKARQEKRSEAIGYKKSMTIFDDFVIEKVGIRKINIDPFYVIYWLDEQITFWNKIHDIQSITLSLDVTGGMLKSTVYENIKSHSLLYYSMVVGVESKIVSVLQFISSVHHVPVIEEALRMWVEEGRAEIPKSMSTDGSPTLQNVASLVFNRITFAEQNLVNYKYLLGMKVDLPKCAYKSDRPHLLRTLNEWRCLKSRKPEVVLFYKRCIAFMTKIKTIEEFEKMALALLVVSQSQVVPAGSPCERYLEFLEDVIKTHKVKLTQTIEKSEADEVANDRIYPEVKLNKPVNILTYFIEGIVKKVIENASPYTKKKNDPPNEYCVLKLKKNFQTLCQKFTTWTDLMMSAYGLKGEDINSARSEGNFKKKKSQIPRPISLLRFLLFDAKKIYSYVNRDYPTLRFRHLSDPEEPERNSKDNI